MKFKHTLTFMNYHSLFQQYYKDNEDASLQTAISALKEAGASMIICVRVLMAELQLSISEADQIVLNSTAWQAERQQTEALRAQFWAVWEEESDRKGDNGLDFDLN